MSDSDKQHVVRSDGFIVERPRDPEVIECPFCSGTGTSTDLNAGWIDCPHCGGLGRVLTR